MNHGEKVLEFRDQRRQDIHAQAVEIWECVDQLLAVVQYPEALETAIEDFEKLTEEPPLPRSVQRLAQLTDEYIRLLRRARHGGGWSFAEGALEDLRLCFRRMGGPPEPPARARSGATATRRTPKKPA